MRPAHIHIIGAGLAGLSAAVELATSGARIFVHESAKAAGGRCRSYFDQQLGLDIDNGNHLLLSGNAHALKYIRTIGAEDWIYATVAIGPSRHPGGPCPSGCSRATVGPPTLFCANI